MGAALRDETGVFNSSSSSFLLFRSTAQPVHASYSLLRFTTGQPPFPHPLHCTTLQHRGGPGGRGANRSIYPDFFSHAYITEIPTHTPHRRYPHGYPEPLYIIHIPGQSGTRAATVLFTPSLGRNWRLEGVLGRVGMTMLCAIVSAASRGV